MSSSSDDQSSLNDKELSDETISSDSEDDSSSGEQTGRPKRPFKLPCPCSVSIIGPSQSGKTTMTMMMLLNGVIPDECKPKHIILQVYAKDNDDLDFDVASDVIRARVSDYCDVLRDLGYSAESIIPVLTHRDGIKKLKSLPPLEPKLWICDDSQSERLSVSERKMATEVAHHCRTIIIQIHQSYFAKDGKVQRDNTQVFIFTGTTNTNSIKRFINQQFENDAITREVVNIVRSGEVPIVDRYNIQEGVYLYRGPHDQYPMLMSVHDTGNSDHNLKALVNYSFRQNERDERQQPKGAKRRRMGMVSGEQGGESESTAN
jgi:hypothetical protein